LTETRKTAETHPSATNTRDYRAAIAELDTDALDIIHGVIDALVTETRLHATAATADR
jgi:hypothetical protein